MGHPRLACYFPQRRRRVHGIRLQCDLQHRSVVNGVSEYHVRSGDARLYQRLGLTFSGRNVEQLAGNDPTHYLGPCGNHPGGRNVEAANAFIDDPVVGRTHHPDICPTIVQRGNEGTHFGEDLVCETCLEECRSGPANFQFTQAVVDLNHFPAHGEFRDRAGKIEAVAGVDPIARVAGDDPLFDRPDHEVVSRVSVP